MLTSHLAHLHLYRTGGTMFRNLLRKIPGLEIYDPPEWGQHTNWDKMQQYAREHDIHMPPAVVFARHPREWYVSVWCWINKNNWRDLRGITFEGWMRKVEDSHVRGGPPNMKPWTETWEKLGAYHATYVGRFEHLYDDICIILAGCAPDLVRDLALRRMVEDMAVDRPSLVLPQGKPLSEFDIEEFWSRSMKEQVLEWDGELMERLGYTW